MFGLGDIPLVGRIVNYFGDLLNGTNYGFDDKLFTYDEIYKSNKRPIKTENMKISELKNLLKPGDMVEFESNILGIKAYGHWGLFLGINKEGKHILIHLARESVQTSETSYWSQLLNVFERNSGVMSIHLCDLETAAFSNQLGRINNYLDNEKTPNPACYIRKIAIEALKKDAEYDLITNNCEHFVTELRYNEKVSLQVKQYQIFVTIYETLTNIPYHYFSHNV